MGTQTISCKVARVFGLNTSKPIVCGLEPTDFIHMPKTPQVGDFMLLFTYPWHSDSQTRSQGRTDLTPFLPISSSTDLRNFGFHLLCARMRQLSIYPDVCQY